MQGASAANANRYGEILRSKRGPKGIDLGLANMGVRLPMLQKNGKKIAEALDFIGRKKPTLREFCMRFSITLGTGQSLLKVCGERIKLVGDRYELATEGAR